MAVEAGSISGTTDPYKVNTYKPESNDKNTISMTGYFQLLAAQLQNQDMTNPMDNSEIMAQMTQMAMVQSLTAMTNAVDTSTSVTTQTYAGGLLGQEVTMAVVKENEWGVEVPIGVKYATVESVDFTSGSPTIRLKDDPKTYQLAHVVGMGKVPDPYNTEVDTGDPDEDKKPDGVGKPDETEKPGESEKPEETDKTDKPETPGTGDIA